MSYALRHDPGALDLVLDGEGWVPIDDLLKAIVSRPRWHWIQAEHIHEVVETCDKKRYERKGDSLRARYGHSKAARPTYEPVEPPEHLYHGTPRGYLPAIRMEGLKAMSRQYVHLSTTPDMARQVGSRRDKKPVILTIRAGEACASGIRFGKPSEGMEGVWLAERIPPAFIEVPEGET